MKIPSDRIYSILAVSNLSSEQFSIKISDDFSVQVTIIGEKQYINNNPTMIGFVYINRGDTFSWVGDISANHYQGLDEVIDILQSRVKRLASEVVLRSLKRLGEVKKLRQAKMLSLINSIDELFK